MIVTISLVIPTYPVSRSFPEIALTYVKSYVMPYLEAWPLIAYETISSWIIENRVNWFLNF